jgi:hypothetical protein
MVALIPGPEDGESYTDSFAVATSAVSTVALRVAYNTLCSNLNSLVTLPGFEPEFEP